VANVNGGLVSQNQHNQPAQQMNVKRMLMDVNYKKRFEEILGKKAAGFMSSVVNLTNSDTNLSNCEPHSVIASAVVAATLDLPIDKNLGFAWIVPYGKRAQFQMGYKGYVQLALRTGQYKNINVIEIFKDQLKSWNPLTEELEFDFENNESEEVVGYAAFFKLINGFEKTVYWSKNEVLFHAKRFSKTFKNGPWQTDFDGMAKKTVLKSALSKWGILSIEMQKAIETDQAVIKEEVASGAEINSSSVEYADNPENHSNVHDVEYTETGENEEKQSKDDYAGTPFAEGGGSNE
jgi:recombination protein RecT